MDCDLKDPGTAFRGVLVVSQEALILLKVMSYANPVVFNVAEASHAVASFCCSQSNLRRYETNHLIS